MKFPSVVILAAGKGTRMFSDIPKVLHKLAGKPLLQHVLDQVVKLGSEAVCVIYGHGGDAVPVAMGRRYDAQFVLQSPQLGTGHAVQQAMPYLTDGGNTLVLYGDVPLIQENTLLKMQQANRDLVLLTVFLNDPTGYGRIIRDKNGKIQAIVEEKDATAEQKNIKEVNTGILLASTYYLRMWLANLQNNNAQKEYYLTDIIAMAVAQGVDVIAIHPENDWEVVGINNKVQLAELEHIWRMEQSKNLLKAGVTLADPSRVEVRGALTCGRDVEIDIGCIFEGDVLLGDNVKIGAYTTIRNSKLSAGTSVLPYCHIDQSEIGMNCHIGPYARLRPGTRLESDVHIGNFVEVKNSEILTSSKVNHLSYIGDASIGSRVNVGAGTITCNYDGANKHRTVVGDDVFIGSDTQLIAPVVVGNGSTIGAGSTITRDTTPGELTLSRSKQVTVSGWKRPQKGNK